MSRATGTKCAWPGCDLSRGVVISGYLKGRLRQLRLCQVHELHLLDKAVNGLAGKGLLAAAVASWPKATP